MGPSDVSIDPLLFFYRQPHQLAVLGTSQFYDPPVRRIRIAVRDMEAQSTNEILPERLVSRSTNPTSVVASGEEHNADAFSNGTHNQKYDACKHVSNSRRIYEIGPTEDRTLT
jgi:hypothetical protein